MPAAYRNARLAHCQACGRLIPLDGNLIGWHFGPRVDRILCPGSQHPPRPH